MRQIRLEINRLMMQAVSGPFGITPLHRHRGLVRRSGQETAQIVHVGQGRAGMPFDQAGQAGDGCIGIALRTSHHGNEAAISPPAHTRWQRGHCRIGRAGQCGIWRAGSQDAAMQHAGQPQVMNKAGLAKHFVSQVQPGCACLSQQASLSRRLGARCARTLDVQVDTPQQRRVVAKVLPLR